MPDDAGHPPLTQVLSSVITAAVDTHDRVALLQTLVRGPAPIGPADDASGYAPVFVLPRPRPPLDDDPPAA